ncbi:unnamed protein product [Linum trigynum]|uniref:Barwin domain-containing protein n=1 Tax=Linum trigynum TaxID=586398 RepID=A0AAV2FZ97_9ROSI
MESAMKVVAILILVVVAVAVLNAGPSSGQYCGKRSDGGWTQCDAGTCCGTDNYCSKLGCSEDCCQYYCPKDQTDGGVAVQQVLARRGIDGVVGDRKPNNVNAFSSSSTSSSEVLSCAPSLSRLSLNSRQRYPWAALGGGNITTAICGRCLKVTTAGAGGVDAQVKVRIVHTPAIEGLELDRDTFSKLDTNGSDNDYNYNRIMVRYQFESC